MGKCRGAMEGEECRGAMLELGRAIDDGECRAMEDSGELRAIIEDGGEWRAIIEEQAMEECIGKGFP